MPGTEIEAGLSVYLAAGIELAGPDAASVGLFTGVRAPSFPGIASDWAAVRSLQAAAVEFASRALSGRERARSAAVVAISTARLADNLRGGQAVRQDDFFSPKGRGAGDEFAESILTAAARDPEEAKLPHYGALFANVACHSRTEPAHALLLAKLAAEISYRQFVLLALIGNRQRFKLRTTDYVDATRLAVGTVAALHELADLERRGLLLQAGGAIGNPRDLIPNGLTPVGLGEMLVKRLGLNRIDGEVLAEVASLLS
jgi:hypothetical protein